MPVWTDLFSLLWSNLLDSVDKEHIVIPETAIFEGHICREWYLPDSKSGGLFKRQIKPNVNSELLHSLSNGNMCANNMSSGTSKSASIVATMIWYSESAPKLPQMRHLNSKELRALLLGTELVELPMGNWLLQAFIPPTDVNGNLVTLVCEQSGLRSTCKLIQNRHRYSPSQSQTHITIEGRDNHAVPWGFWMGCCQVWIRCLTDRSGVDIGPDRRARLCSRLDHRRGDK